MQWIDIRQSYPEQWLIVEALEAHTEDNRRFLDRIAVVETCPDGSTALQSYRRLHQQYPLREFYFSGDNPLSQLHEDIFQALDLFAKGEEGYVGRDEPGD